MTGNGPQIVPIVRVEASELFEAQMKKTVLCKFYAAGRCKRGTSCGYAHHSAELRISPDLRKTSLCQAFKRGQTCRVAAECPFAHGAHELQITPMFQARSKYRRGISSQGGEQGHELKLGCQNPARMTKEFHAEHAQEQGGDQGHGLNLGFDILGRMAKEFHAEHEQQLAANGPPEGSGGSSHGTTTTSSGNGGHGTSSTSSSRGGGLEWLNPLILEWAMSLNNRVLASQTASHYQG